jgi:hypothetical protein
MKNKSENAKNILKKKKNTKEIDLESEYIKIFRLL